MAIEIERKFLVKDKTYKALASKSERITQAYISVRPESTVRVRIKDDKAFITVKGCNQGVCRKEWEYPISIEDARDMIAECACTTILDKTRYIVGNWEIDEFHRQLEGLVIAEIELEEADQKFSLPDFIGREVTGDTRYYNSVLAETTQMPPTR